MKTIIKIQIVVLMMVSSSIKILGQEKPSIIEHEIYPNWYYIGDNEYNSSSRNSVSYLTKSNFIPTCKSEFNLTINDELVVKKTFSVRDIISSTNLSRSNRVTKYQQYYNGYKVESSIIITQDISDTINLVLGKLVGNLNIDTSNPISEAQALSLAINALEYPPTYLDTTIMNSWCLEEDGSFDSICYNSFLPCGELCISKKNTDSLEPCNFRFVWKYDIITTDGNEYRVLINAQNGSVYDISNITMEGKFELGSLQTLYDGYYENAMETFKCTLCLRWKLKNSNGNITMFRNDHVKSWNNEWTDELTRPASTAHWTIYELKDYYESIFNNTNITKDVKIDIKGTNFHNARYMNNLIEIGYTQQGKSFAAIDVIGHELAHKLVKENADLGNKGESGALNESFADIFGIMAERHIRNKYNKTWNWTIGENIGIIRSLSNPKLYNQPDYYKGLYWIDTDVAYDGGGIHKNSGVQNKWFYNLSQSIGIDKAELIAYTTLCGFLTPTSVYHDVLFASVFASESIYGKCSEERNAVIRAWKSVGISSNSLPYCANFEDSSSSSQRLAICENEIGEDVSIYPNPANDHIIIDLPDNLSNGNIILFNHLGIVEYETRIDSNSTIIETHNLNNGIHYLKIISDNKIIKIQKVVINN
ncbi:MAG: M4 family metallopeptidase [Bacteroidales bacterium]|nr:M4 family metallopeptidase [Bacteroidales bacterium]